MPQIRYYLSTLALAAAAGLLLWRLSLPWRQSRRRAKGISPGRRREAALLFFTMFLTGLLALVLTPPAGWAYRGPFQGTVNLAPVRESLRLFRFYLQHGMWTVFLVNFLGNIVLFVPVGFFASLLSDKPRWWKGALWAFLLSFLIEVAQLFVCRGTDVDDLILNTLGGVLGHGCFALLRRVAPRWVRECAKSQKGSG